MKITLKHSGQLHINSGDDFQCGARGKESYDYAVEITAEDKDLNESSGFLVSHENLTSLFERMTHMPSGERFCVHAVREVQNLCRSGYDFKPSCVRVRLENGDKTVFEAYE